MRKDDPEAIQKAARWFAETTLHRLQSLEAGADDLDKRIKDVRTDGEDLEERVAAAERQVGNLEYLADRLRLGVVAILSHAIRRQHSPCCLFSAVASFSYPPLCRRGSRSIRNCGNDCGTSAARKPARP